MFKRNVLSVLALGAFVTLATGSGDSSSTYEDDWEIDIEDDFGAPEPSGPAIEISSKDLAAEYDKNEIAADNKYGGKTVRVTGEFQDMGKDFMDEVYITLEGKDLFQSVHVYFGDDDAEGKAAELSKGDTVTIEGECDGMIINVQIVDAVFVD